MPLIGTAGGQFGYGRPVQPPASIITNGLLLYLDAGNSSSYPGSGTTWTDLSPNANNATSLTGVTYSASNGGYLSFNGAGSGSLDTNKYNQSYTGKSVFVAANLTNIGTGTYRALLGSSVGSRNFNFYLYSPSLNTYQLHFSAGSGGLLSVNISYTPGNWFTAGYTQATDGTTIFYFNGAQVGTSQSLTFSQYQSSTEWIGRADNYWLGPIGVICVYKTTLSAADMASNHNSVKGRYGL